MMKNIILIVITVLFASCKNNEKENSDIINKNNLFLQDEISIYNARLYSKSYEQPNQYDSITCKKISDLLSEIQSIKNYSDYRYINSKITKIAIDEKLNSKFDSIANNEKDVLKNSLLLNLIHLNKLFFNKKSGVIYDFSFNPSIQSETKKDTLILNFYNHNNYVITTDSIIDGKSKIVNYKSYNKSNIWQIKYTQKSNKSIYYGRILEVDSDGNTYLIKKVKQTISK